MSGARLWRAWLPLLVLLLGTHPAPWALAASTPEGSRFPQPDFETGYRLPATPVPAPRALSLEYLDVAVLLAALSLATWLALRSRSRRGLYLLGIFSTLYFGFWRKGCICAVGSTQNVMQALADPSSALPLSALAFFVLPLLFALLFGRTFCAGVCPLGGIQDLVVLRPVRVPRALAQALGLLPYLYLGAVLLFAATGAGYMICRYEPFVPLYRMSGTGPMLLAGGAFLVAGVWVARPYCRFLCPYGVLLKWASLLSRDHVAITPAECVACRLCEGACPFGAIRAPAPERPPERPAAGRRRLAALLLLLPLMVVAGGWLGGRTQPALSRVHPTVRLAEEVRREELGLTRETTPAIEAFRQTATPASVLLGEAEALRRRFRLGGMLLGAFVGLVVGGKLVGLSRLRRRTIYEPDRGECLSCGRCFESCPIDHLRRHGGPGRYAELLASLGRPAPGRAAKARGGGAS